MKIYNNAGMRYVKGYGNMPFRYVNTGYGLMTEMMRMNPRQITRHVAPAREMAYPAFKAGVEMARQQMDTLSAEGSEVLGDLLERPARMSKKAEKILTKMASRTKKKVAKKVKKAIEKALPKKLDKALSKKQKEKLSSASQAVIANLMKGSGLKLL